MKKNSNLDLLNKHLSAFEKLKRITYKDIYINGVGIRILGIHFMDYGPKWAVKKHRHSFYEYHYVLRGNVCSTVDEVEYKVKEGCFYLMSPGTFHSHVQKDELGHLGIAIRWEFLDENAPIIKEPLFKGNSIEEGEMKDNNSKESKLREKMNKENTFDDLNKIEKLARDISHEPTKDDKTIFANIIYLLEMTSRKYQPFQLQIEMVQLIINILNFYPTNNLDKQYFGKQNSDLIIQKSQIKSSNVDQNDILKQQDKQNNYSISENRIINAAIQFIQDNCYQQIDVCDVANSIHFSYSYLAKLFKRHMGETMTQYTNRLRVNNAFKMLKCTDKKISQIAVESGFITPNYFCMVFHKQYGKSPESVRKETLPIRE